MNVLFNNKRYDFHDYNIIFKNRYINIKNKKSNKSEYRIKETRVFNIELLKYLVENKGN